MTVFDWVVLATNAWPKEIGGWRWRRWWNKLQFFHFNCGPGLATGEMPAVNSMSKRSATLEKHRYIVGRRLLWNENTFWWGLMYRKCNVLKSFSSRVLMSHQLHMVTAGWALSWQIFMHTSMTLYALNFCLPLLGDQHKCQRWPHRFLFLRDSKCWTHICTEHYWQISLRWFCKHGTPTYTGTHIHDYKRNSIVLPMHVHLLVNPAL